MGVIAMAMKVYFIFPRDTELESNEQMQSSVILRTLFWLDLIFYREYNQRILSHTSKEWEMFQK